MKCQVNVLLLTVVLVQSAITGPGHQVALVGSSLSLTCTTDAMKEVCWEYYPNHASIPRTIYTGRRVNRQYRGTHQVAEKGNGTVTLTLVRVKLHDAGMYQCRECTTIHLVDIEVTVLG